MIKRFLRIWPGLAGNIVLTVLVLGMLFSTLSFEDYLMHITTLQYLENMLVFRTYYHLPGVFDSSALNGSLWTISYEFTCYLILSVIFLLKWMRNKYAFVFISIIWVIIYFTFQAQMDQLVIPILGITIKSLALPMMFFLSGVCFYLFRYRLHWGVLQIVVSCMAVVAIMFGWLPRELMIVILPYLVFMVAFSHKINLHHFGRFGDLSYGFYLYAFPIKKCFAEIGTNWPLSILVLLSFTTTLILAFASWHLIEKPCLRLKSRLTF